MVFNIQKPNGRQTIPRIAALVALFAAALSLVLMSSYLLNLTGFRTVSTATNAASAGGQLAIGTNLAGVADWSTQLPFVDGFKSSRPWMPQCKAGEPGCSGSWTTNDQDKLDLDEHGWVKSLPAPEDPPEYTRVGTLLYREIEGRYPGGQYLVLYEGEGMIEYGFDAQKDQAASRPGRDVINVTPSDAGIWLQLTATDPNQTGNYIRNIRVIPVEAENTYQTEIFNPAFVERVKQFAAIRFMDWMATNDSQQREWADRPKPEDASYALGKGVPLEIMIELANQTGVNPWFNMPHQASDDYMTQFAQMVKDRLDPKLRAYVEFSNEVWNWQFQQANYALEQGKARWGQDKGDAFMQWYGMRAAQMSDIWKRVFDREGDRVVSVMATQTGWLGLENQALDCSYWVAEGNSPCYQHGFDAYAITGYFSGNLGKPEHTSEVESWLKQPDGGFSKAIQQLGASGTYGDSVADTHKGFQYHAKVAQERGLQLVVYEGGQHITGSQGVENNQKLTDFFIELNRRPEMYDLYTELLNHWKATNGTLFMHYFDINQPSKWGSWGALEHLDQEGSPKYDALMDFITSNGLNR